MFSSKLTITFGVALYSSFISLRLKLVNLLQGAIKIKDRIQTQISPARTHPPMTLILKPL